MTDHGLPRALYNAFPWAPRGSSSQYLEDEALLSMDEVTPGAFVMITVLVVTIVICSPSGVISLVCVVVVWDELGSGPEAGVEGIDTPGAAEAFAPPWTVQERSPQRRRPGSSAAPALDGGGMGGWALGSAPAHAFGIHSQGIEWFPGTGTQQPGTLMGGRGPSSAAIRSAKDLGMAGLGLGACESAPRALAFLEASPRAAPTYAALDPGGTALGGGSLGGVRDRSLVAFLLRSGPGMAAPGVVESQGQRWNCARGRRTTIAGPKCLWMLSWIHPARRIEQNIMTKT